MTEDRRWGLGVREMGEATVRWCKIRGQQLRYGVVGSYKVTEMLATDPLVVRGGQKLKTDRAGRL
jgi:hypothetical protein